MSPPDKVRRTPISQQSITTANNESVLYDLQIDGKESAHIFSIFHNVLHNLLIRSSEQITYTEPIHIHEETDIEEWKRSLTYDDNQINNLLRQILFDFGLEQVNENIDWLKENVDSLISMYEKRYEFQLERGTRLMVFNLLVRMAYDKLCMKNPI